MTKRQCWWLRAAWGCLVYGAVGASSLRGQSAPSAGELQSQLDSVQARLEKAQQQIDQDHLELLQLRKQLESLQSAISPAADLQQAVAGLQEQQAIHQAQIQVHEQEKIETASKYQVKLHGLLLFNAAVNNGAPDQPILPLLALPPGTAASGSLAASGRQTLLGLAATGPELWGARTYADVEMDFSGGLSSGGYTVGGSLLRLRTAALQMVWPNTTLQAGIAPLILTPEYATSYFNIAQPALSWSGALWSWLPQLSIEQRWEIFGHQQLSLQAALADIPDAGENSNSGLGAVSAAERSRYPGSELRAAWHRGAGATIGLGGYWSPHAYAGSATVDAWAGTIDGKVLLPARFEFSGEAYRGSALGGLSAGAFKDVVTYSNSADSNVTGLRDAGGWTQLKFKPRERLEFNLAFGLDNADTRQLRQAEIDETDPFARLARNQTVFGNMVFRPTSTLILSGEYRRIRSWGVNGPGDHASRFGLAAGYAF